MTQNKKNNDLNERIDLFNAELILLQKKYELKLGVEMVYSPQGIVGKPVVMDKKGDKTEAKDEDITTNEEVVNDEPEKTLDK